MIIKRRCSVSIVHTCYRHRVRYCSLDKINSGSELHHITLILSELMARCRDELYKTLHERGKELIESLVTNSGVFFQAPCTIFRMLGAVDRMEEDMTEVDERRES